MSKAIARFEAAYTKVEAANAVLRKEWTEPNRYSRYQAVMDLCGAVRLVQKHGKDGKITPEVVAALTTRYDQVTAPISH